MIYEPNDLGNYEQTNRAREEHRPLTRTKMGGELMKQYFRATTNREVSYTFNDDDDIADWAPCMNEARKMARDV